MQKLGESKPAAGQKCCVTYFSQFGRKLGTVRAWYAGSHWRVAANSAMLTHADDEWEPAD